MKLAVNRKDIKFYPDFKKVIPRFFQNGDERAQDVIENVIKLPDNEAKNVLNQVLREFSTRHRNITKIFENNYIRVKHIASKMLEDKHLSETKKLLVGAYFTMEYSIESSAFFNPSMIEDPDQSGVEYGKKQVIVSFRATGEGHISSVVFRRGVLDEMNNLTFYSPGNRISEAEVIKNHLYNKKMFVKKLSEMGIPSEISEKVTDQLPEKFIYREVMIAVKKAIDSIQEPNPEYEKMIKEIVWVADSHYDLRFSLDTDLSERVIFPIANAENRGIEDARFVQFKNESGQSMYYATFTAFDGLATLPKLISTDDFIHFRIEPIHGKAAINKNLALFPKKIKGKYAMLSRIDGVNNYIMFSDKLLVWEEASILQKPKYPWEFTQIGNGGSPIETSKGWLLITHGVGPMRKYCLGASLLDINDPTKELGRLKEPLLMPNENEREGYVPNVVYTCGPMVNRDEVIIPYAISDYASTFATVSLPTLLDAILENS